MLLRQAICASGKGTVLPMAERKGSARTSSPEGVGERGSKGMIDRRGVDRIEPATRIRQCHRAQGVSVALLV